MRRSAWLFYWRRVAAQAWKRASHVVFSRSPKVIIRDVILIVLSLSLLFYFQDWLVSRGMMSGDNVQDTLIGALFTMATFVAVFVAFFLVEMVFICPYLEWKQVAGSNLALLDVDAPKIIDLFYDKTRPMDFGYLVRANLPKNCSKAVLTVRCAIMVHFFDGSAKWEWKLPPHTLYEGSDRLKGEKVEREVVFRGRNDGFKIYVGGEQISISQHSRLEMFLIEVVLNVDGTTFAARKVFEAHTPRYPVTRVQDPATLSFPVAEPS